MAGRRAKWTFIGGCAIGFLAALALVMFHWRRPPAPSWRLVAARSYYVHGTVPPAINGDYQVEADFDCTGLDLRVKMPSRIQRWFARRGLLRLPPVGFPHWKPAPIVLRDGSSRGLARLQSYGPAATTQSARMGWGNAQGARVTVIWNFCMPPNLRSAGPVHFTTSLGVNGMPPVPVEVILHSPAAVTSAPFK